MGALDWRVFLQDPGGEHANYLRWMLAAWGWTVFVSASSLVLALVVGSAVGTLRTLPDRPIVVKLGDAWVELFRNVPLLVQVFIWYHVIPAFVPALKGVSSVVLIILALGMFTSARVAELVRSGIQSLPKGQRQAALAVGLSTPQAYRYVLLPIALRIVIPPLTSEAMNIVKNSSVAFAVSVPELTMFAMQAQEETARGVEIYLGVTLLYMTTSFGINRLMGAVERSARIPGLLMASGAH